MMWKWLLIGVPLGAGAWLLLRRPAAASPSSVDGGTENVHVISSKLGLSSIVGRLTTGSGIGILFSEAQKSRVLEIVRAIARNHPQTQFVAASWNLIKSVVSTEQIDQRAWGGVVGLRHGNVVFMRNWYPDTLDSQIDQEIKAALMAVAGADATQDVAPVPVLQAYAELLIEQRKTPL